jgi:hypothetical protein
VDFGRHPANCTSGSPVIVAPWPHSIEMDSNAARLKALTARVSNAEKRLQALQEKANDGVERVKRDLFKRSVYNAIFVTVPDDYYDRLVSLRLAA